MNSAFQREYSSEVPTPGAETRLSTLIILLKSTRYSPVLRNQKGSNFSDSAFHVT